MKAPLSKLNAELSRLQKRQPAARKILANSLLQSELQMWQGQLVALNHRLLQARFDKERKMAGLNLVVVEKPQRGKLLEVPSARWTAWQLWLQRLPESLFFGILLSFAVHFLRGQQKREARIEEAMGLTVIGRIPRTSGGLCR